MLERPREAILVENTALRMFKDRQDWQDSSLRTFQAEEESELTVTQSQDTCRRRVLAGPGRSHSCTCREGGATWGRRGWAPGLVNKDRFVPPLPPDSWVIPDWGKPSPNISPGQESRPPEPLASWSAVLIVYTAASRVSHPILRTSAWVRQLHTPQEETAPGCVLPTPLGVGGGIPQLCPGGATPPSFPTFLTLQSMTPNINWTSKSISFLLQESFLRGWKDKL